MSSKTIVAKIAQPYAEALLEISKNTGSLSSTSQEVKLIADTFSSSSQLKEFFSNPLTSIEAKKELLEKVFSQNVSTPILNFLMILTERRRISIFNAIAEKYLELAYEVSNITLAKIIASVALTEKQQEALSAKIKSMTKASEVQLLIQVDPDLIGGLTIQVGSQVIDTSLQGQIKQMAAHLDITL
uniref:ATP synthase CF1 delta subunit n=1 Tax=Tsunamia transpacifica TaxID=1935457 RepID=UPI001BEEE6BA|nr:ATP synthase CF1 delta subunit [Tsunamia transpacifica]QUE27925.1 AtpD [Tsunamia transpacifica]UNJ14440.1 ATP synthase CF1 delta subunit [Tsunamia transpacifica]